MTIPRKNIRVPIYSSIINDEMFMAIKTAKSTPIILKMLSRTAILR